MASSYKDEKTATGLRDMESVQKLMTSPVLMAIFDIPWTPFFLVGIMIFHPWLGYLGIARRKHSSSSSKAPAALGKFVEKAGHFTDTLKAKLSKR